MNRLHALLGGFHLGPAPVPYIAQAVAELKALEPDVVVPMHCSGLNFVQAVREQMPDRLLVSSHRHPPDLQRLTRRRVPCIRPGAAMGAVARRLRRHLLCPWSSAPRGGSQLPPMRRTSSAGGAHGRPDVGAGG